MPRGYGMFTGECFLYVGLCLCLVSAAFYLPLYYIFMTCFSPPNLVSWVNDMKGEALRSKGPRSWHVQQSECFLYFSCTLLNVCVSFQPHLLTISLLFHSLFERMKSYTVSERYPNVKRSGRKGPMVRACYKGECFLRFDLCIIFAVDVGCVNLPFLRFSCVAWAHKAMCCERTIPKGQALT